MSVLLGEPAAGAARPLSPSSGPASPVPPSSGPASPVPPLSGPASPVPPEVIATPTAATAAQIPMHPQAVARIRPDITVAVASLDAASAAVAVNSPDAAVTGRASVRIGASRIHEPLEAPVVGSCSCAFETAAASAGGGSDVGDGASNPRDTSVGKDMICTNFSANASQW